MTGVAWTGKRDCGRRWLRSFGSGIDIYKCLDNEPKL